MDALIVVDVQEDFLPGGALPTKGGDAVVPVANRMMQQFDLVVAARDWHPPGHGSFASAHPGRKVGDVIDLDGLEQILWPDHCVQGTPGAEFADGLHVDEFDKVFLKGTDPGIDSYSAFFDNGHRKATGLGDYLQGQEVFDVYVTGLTIEVCVKFTVLDACRLGFRTFVVVDGCRGLEQEPGDVEEALEAMRRAGARMVESDVVVSLH